MLPAHPIRCALCVALLAAAASVPPLAAQDYKAALEELLKAEKLRDPEAFSSAARALLRDDSARAVREVCESYGRLASGKPPMEGVVHFRIHSEIARALGDIGTAPGQDELARQRDKSQYWQTRCLCLDAASFKPEVLGLRAAAMARLQDKQPAVVRRALVYLQHDRQLSVVDAVIARYQEVDLPKGPKGEDWNRLRLAFRSALTALLKVGRNAAVDYRNYVDARRSVPADLFEKPPDEKGLTRLSLFGMEVSGNNLAFVLDISGSMMSTDPVVLVAEPGKTETFPKTKAREAQMLEDRRRINRAKKELIKVVQALPEGKKFNIITYSSDVSNWKKTLVPMNAANRKEAVEHIQGLKAEGLTVTDDALEAAFTDLAVDTIYLITDGAPTHVGVQGDQMPPDAEDIIRKIHKRVREINYFRGVRVFTLGFPEAEEEFLKRLAAENAGQYGPIR